MYSACSQAWLAGDAMCGRISEGRPERLAVMQECNQAQHTLNWGAALQTAASRRLGLKTGLPSR